VLLCRDLFIALYKDVTLYFHRVFIYLASFANLHIDLLLHVTLVIYSFLLDGTIGFILVSTHFY